ncbi:MAG: YbfB/YjiJ family MFS transporter [Alcaligenaceae bacterium]|nr:YbfB/YjiJ family MFS transporter [Alcaligenaceae bacterium]
MSRHVSAAQLCLAGFIALSVAMGIGRFAFTPILPMMQRDFGLDLALAGWLASANYLGYLAGALTSAALPWKAPAQLVAALALVAATTLLMGWTTAWPVWLALRCLAGLASAWALVSTATLCMARLAALGQGRLSGLVFTGVGASIALVGLLCMMLDIAMAGSSATWLIMGVLALAGMLGTRPLWGASSQPAAQAAAAHAPDGQAPGAGRRHATIIGAYGLFGFGYILPATFLPAQAKQLIDDPAVFGLAWPLFGLAAAVSTLLTARLLAVLPRRRLWALAQFIMAVGVLLPVLRPGIASIALAALCVGGTFMVVTLLGLQEAHAVGGRHAQKLIAALTAAFALGQLAGPAVFSLGNAWLGLSLESSLALAATALLAGSALLWRPAAR